MSTTPKGIHYTVSWMELGISHRIETNNPATARSLWLKLKHVHGHCNQLYVQATDNEGQPLEIWPEIFWPSAQHRWKTAKETIQVNEIRKGKLELIAGDWLFFDLGEGLHCTMHGTDATWKFQGPHYLDELIIGTEHTLQIVQRRFERKQPALRGSIRATKPNPWENLDAQLPFGKPIKGKVTKTGAKMTVKLAPEIEVNIHERDQTTEQVWPGKEITITIVRYDKRRNRLIGSMKGTDNVWKRRREKYPIGEKVTLKINNITHAGIFGQIEEGLIGYIHNNDLDWKQRLDPREKYQTDTEVEAVVIEHTPMHNSIRLSIKHLTPSPWGDGEKQHPVGQELTGTILCISNRGYLIQLRSGFLGFLPRPETAAPDWKTGQSVGVRIQSVDAPNEKIHLTLPSSLKKAPALMPGDKLRT